MSERGDKVYLIIDRKILWQMAINDIPALFSKLSKIIEKEGWESEIEDE